MQINKGIALRLNTLKFNIDDISTCYNDTLKDTYLECGIEIDKSYPLNNETYKLLNKEEELRKLREQKLYSSIFCFTQTFYSIKEYLKKEYPHKKEVVEKFFSDKEEGAIARKDICNDLKHNPERDLNYEFREVSKEIVNEPNQRIIKMQFRNSWFYGGIESVEYCNKLYTELVEFIKVNFINS